MYESFGSHTNIIQNETTMKSIDGYAKVQG
jgi:hypothetical protein